MVTHPDELELLARSLLPEQLLDNSRQSIEMILPYTEQGQRSGQIIAGNSLVLASTIRSVTLMTLHRDTIGREQSTAVINQLIDLVAHGLTHVPD